MQVKLLTPSGNDAGLYEISDSIFALSPKPDILSRVIHWQLSKRRQGTHKAKERGDVSGTTKKMNRQKGSGTARHGSRRGAQFRGGGIIFGPVVRSHQYSLPKKIRSLGLKMALSDKALSGNLYVVQSLIFDSPKTKEALKVFPFLKDKKTLFIDGNHVHDSVKMAFSNLESANILPQMGANVYDIVRNHHVILSLDGLKEIEERLS